RHHAHAPDAPPGSLSSGVLWVRYCDSQTLITTPFAHVLLPLFLNYTCAMPVCENSNIPFSAAEWIFDEGRQSKWWFDEKILSPLRVGIRRATPQNKRVIFCSPEGR